MLSLRQSLAKIGKNPPIRVPGEISLPCKSLRDTMIAWNKLIYNLLIIAPQEFIEPLKQLAEYKTNTGIPTILISLDHIYRAYPGRDEAEKVKRFLALFRANNMAQYAMLVGDVDKFPVRFTKWYYRDPSNPNSDPEFHSWFIPTDLYYAALFKPSGSFSDWDENKDGYYEVPGTGTNPDKVSVIPYIAVGRIPASTKEDVDRYITKIKEYESHAFGSTWLKSALFVEGDWDLSAHSDLNSIASKYLPGYNLNKLYLSGGTKTPNSTNINAYINPPNGVRLMIYIGHGAIDSWSIKNDAPTISYGPNELDGLSNTEALPIIFAMACDTGRFTFLPPLTKYKDINGVDHDGTWNGEIFTTFPPQPACLQKEDMDSMAEHTTVRRKTGAIAYIGCIINSQTNTYELLDPFIKEFAGSLTLGDAWVRAVYSLYQKYPLDPNSGPVPGSGENFTVPWKFNLIGDPSLRLSGI